MKYICTICGEEKETEHFRFYVIGSEGTNLCHECKMMVTHFIRDVRIENQRGKLRAIKENLPGFIESMGKATEGH